MPQTNPYWNNGRFGSTMPRLQGDGRVSVPPWLQRQWGAGQRLNAITTNAYGQPTIRRIGQPAQDPSPTPRIRLPIEGPDWTGLVPKMGQQSVAQAPTPMYAPPSIPFGNDGRIADQPAAQPQVVSGGYGGITANQAIARQGQAYFADAGGGDQDMARQRADDARAEAEQRAAEERSMAFSASQEAAQRERDALAEENWLRFQSGDRSGLPTSLQQQFRWSDYFGGDPARITSAQTAVAATGNDAAMRAAMLRQIEDMRYPVPPGANTMSLPGLQSYISDMNRNAYDQRQGDQARESFYSQFGRYPNQPSGSSPEIDAEISRIYEKYARLNTYGSPEMYSEIAQARARAGRTSSRLPTSNAYSFYAR